MQAKRFHERESAKVIGLLGLNGLDTEGRFDLGHVILSQYQENDIDKEGLSAIVDYIFQNKGVEATVTSNPDHLLKLGPLKSLGFKVINEEHKGTLVRTRTEWQERRR
jgi:hypothetical protein